MQVAPTSSRAAAAPVRGSSSKQRVVHTTAAAAGRTNTSVVTRSLSSSSSSAESGSSSQDSSSTNRRAALLTAVAASGAWLVAAREAAAVCADLDTAEAGDACRQKELAVDESRSFKGEYKTLSGAGPKKVAPNVPVGALGGEYAASTRELAAKIDEYISIDVYDKKRQPLIKELKADALAWVSRFARGGSVRAQSARNVYIAADAVLGHLASNGLAPLPASKAKVVQETLSKGLAFLDEGK